MRYVLDTSFFTKIRYYYPEVFLAFWNKMDEAVREQMILSVREVKKELERYGGEQDGLLGWIKQNGSIFTMPTDGEQLIVRELLENFPLIKKKKQLRGGPLADPFVIAKARAIEHGTVVTDEKRAVKNKNNKNKASIKIPDVCDYYGIKCLSPKDFMKNKKWQF